MNELRLAAAVALLAVPALASNAAAQGLEYTAIDGCRVLDTRRWNGTTSSTIPNQRAVEFHLSNEFGTVASQGGDAAGCPAIPDDAAAFAVTVTPVAPAFPGAYPGVGFATLLPWDFGTWAITGATPAGNLIYSYTTPPFRESASIVWDTSTGLIANTTIVRACESCSYHAKLYTSGTSHFVVDVVGIYSEVSAVQNLTDAGLLNNGAGAIAQNNSTLQVTLNADLLDGLHATAFAPAGHNHSANDITSGTLSTARYSAYSDLANEGYLANAAGDIARNNGALQVTLNADLLDGLSESAFVRSTGDTMTGTLTINTATSPYGFLAYGNTAGGYAALENGDHTSYAYLGRDGYGVFTSNNAADGYAIWAQNLTAGGMAGFFRGDVSVDGDLAIDNATSGNGQSLIINQVNGDIRGFTDDGATNTFEIDWDLEGWVAIKNSSGFTTITLDGDYAGTGDGRIITDELQITGGSDLSENFDLAPTDVLVEPGMILSIDPERPGQLAVSTQPYDHKVAGIISGADGVKPGLIMGQRGTIADGAYPVALTGRVYCLADASEHPIQPGDLLTTSAIPGHAMKVTDHGKASGAIIGKAMTSLEGGQGKVLVLVSLQ